MWKITKEEWALAGSFALLGLVFTSRMFLLFLNGLSPTWGFLIYYLVAFVSVYILAKFGLVLFGYKIKNVWQIVGTLLILFSFFLIFNWTSPYINYVTNGSLTGMSNVYINNSEDGIAWYFWYTILGVTNISFAWFLTYIFTPFVLTLIGGLLIEKKVRLSP